jgi:hypothetical protein
LQEYAESESSLHCAEKARNRFKHYKVKPRCKAALALEEKLAWLLKFRRAALQDEMRKNDVAEADLTISNVLEFL